MASIAGRWPTRFGGRGFDSRGNVGGGGMAEEARPKDSSIDTGGHLSVLFVLCGLCCNISRWLSAITWNMSSRSSCCCNLYVHYLFIFQSSMASAILTYVYSVFTLYLFYISLYLFRLHNTLIWYTFTLCKPQSSYLKDWGMIPLYFLIYYLLNISLDISIFTGNKPVFVSEGLRHIYLYR